MTNLNPSTHILRWTLICCIFLRSGYTFSQCAGSNGDVTICDKDADTANQSFDLFPHLEATLGVPPSTGGTWSTNDPANFFALDRDTGILNLWKVTNSGEHQFTYTNSCSGGGTESAVVTVFLGGYPGEENIDGTAAACGDDTRVNLFRYVGDDVEGKSQDFNGLWEAVTPGAAAHLESNIFNAETAGPGRYEFTHTVPEVVGPTTTCASRAVRLILQVQPPADSGTGADDTFCITDDLSSFTNYDLNSLLTDEDTNGTWSEDTTTDQLTDLTDRNIDVQAIRDNYGPGTYAFTYTVFPEFAVCERSSTQVNIIILPTLRGTMEAPNYCVGPSEYRMAITDYDQTLMSSGTYEGMTFEISSGSATQREDNQRLELLPDGTGFFNIPASLVPLNETATVSIVELAGVCGDIQVNPVSFAVTNPSATASDTCEGSGVSVDLRNIFDGSVNPANAAYDVTYTLTAPSATQETFSQNAVSFSSGNASFTIPAAQLTETGDYDISFEVDSGFPLDCALTASTTVTAIPPAIDLGLLVDDSCNATNIDVTVDAPNLGDGNYIVSYEVVAQSTGQAAITEDEALNNDGGTASFDIDVSGLGQGNYTVILRSTQDDTTPCRTDFDFEVSENFAVESVPALPEAETEQSFCLSAFAPDVPTLADIVVSANGQIMFYATATDMDILALDIPLSGGEDYFISNIDPDNNCEGSDRIQVTVSLEEPAMPTVIDGSPAFCGSENPTISDMDASVSTSGNIVWFETATGGSALEDSTTLVNGQSYFAATESNGQCLSNDRSEVVPTVYAVDSASLQFATLALCGLDNPTVATLRDAEDDNSFEILWYDVAEGGSPLSDDVLLLSETTYYAGSFNPVTGCMNPERMAVTVDLTDCEPEDYGFFIPDGFSPNGDGRNDTFFVPNIEVIFPDYTLEILNRYGTTLFKGDSSNSAWDGDEAPNGVYFYIVNYNKDDREPLQGRLYLNR